MPRPKRTGKLQLTTRRGSAYWYVSGTVGGRRIVRSTKTTDRNLAEELRLLWEQELQQRRIFGREATDTFAEAAQRYLAGGGSKRFLLPLVEYFQITPTKDITNARLLEAAANLYPGRAPATINRQVIAPVSAIINFGKEDMRRFKKLPEPKGRLPWVTPEQFEDLLAAAQGRGHLPQIMTFLIGTGARVSEALYLPPERINRKTHQALFKDTKTDEQRWADFPPRTAQALGTLGTMDQIGVPIFRRQRDNKPFVRAINRGGQIAQPFKDACIAAGLPTTGPDKITPHTLRHSWATWYYAATTDFVALMQYGGWETAKIARRYTKLAPRDLPERLMAHGWEFSRQNCDTVATKINLSSNYKGL